MICHRLLCLCWVGAAIGCTHDDPDGSRPDGSAYMRDASAPAPHETHDAATPAHDAGAGAVDVSSAAHRAADSGKQAADASTHEEDSGQPDSDHDDDAGVIGHDGMYTCMPLQNYAYDCVDPWLDAVYQRPDGGSAWTFQLESGQLVLDGYGFDRAQISCTGSWSADAFTCAAQWSRAGRVCDNMLHLRAQPDGSLIFSVGMRLEELASCHKASAP